ncbi:MAG: isochorismatase family cysteine hydrolase [archaeon]
MKIFYDVDTQNDFMNKDGALYVPDAELIKPNLKLLTDYAIKNKIPILGSVDRHFGTEEYKEKELELARWKGPFPDHCMAGTYGQEKITETRTEQGIYFEKQSYDIFTNPEFARFLKEKQVTKALVYGVATDYCVKAAVLGMLARKIKCYVVEDAIKGVFPESTNQSLEDMAQAGAIFVKTKNILVGMLK